MTGKKKIPTVSKIENVEPFHKICDQFHWSNFEMEGWRVGVALVGAALLKIAKPQND